VQRQPATMYVSMLCTCGFFVSDGDNDTDYAVGWEINGDWTQYIVHRTKWKLFRITSKLLLHHFGALIPAVFIPFVNLNIDLF
jgi:hypothetical protein